MRLSKIRQTIREDRNGLCVMMEGMFNHLGVDILDMTTIIPLFLSYLGANLETIGAVTTLRSVMGSVVPLLLGSVVAATRSKRNFAMIFNGSSRAAMLLIAVALFMDLPLQSILVLFFIVILYYSFCQPLTGLSWNHLIGAYMPPEKRATMLGILYSASGVLIFLSSYIIKYIRSHPALTEKTQYAWIFLIGGLFVATSVLWYVPLKEDREHLEQRGTAHGKDYVMELMRCYKNKKFRQIIYTQLFANVSTNINTFFFLFAQDTLLFSPQNISDLIVVQTLGVMVGGFVTGWISQRFGVKRMLQTMEALGVLVPVMGLAAMAGHLPMGCSAVALFIIGFMKGGQVGYSSYILEIVPNEKTVYHVVARSLIMIPFSFASILVGYLITNLGNGPVFAIQAALGLGACFFASRLELNVFSRRKTA